MAEMIVNFSNPAEKSLVLNQLRAMEGTHRLTIVKHAKRRTDRQNRYYHPCFVSPFADYLRGQGEAITDLEAHELLKAKFLKKSVIERRTGELLEFVGSTTTLSTTEFNDYLDQCAFWLADTFGIIIPSPDVYHEKEAVKHGA